MTAKLSAFVLGTAAGLLFAWARLTDPAVIQRMLLLQEADVFLLMGSAVAVAAAGSRILRAMSARALLTGEPIGWSVDPPRVRHVAGSVLFGAGWSVAGTCPGPAPAMIGRGRLAGAVVALGLFAGIVLQGALAKRGGTEAPSAETAGAEGL